MGDLLEELKDDQDDDDINDFETILSRDELLNATWPDETDDNINPDEINELDSDEI